MRLGIAAISLMFLAACGPSAAPDRLEPSSDHSADAGHRKATAAHWVEDWCKVKVGMTKAEAEQVMGRPTAYYDATQGEPQDQWEMGAYQFTAFFDGDGRVRSFWVNTDAFSTPERAKLPCLADEFKEIEP